MLDIGLLFVILLFGLLAVRIIFYMIRRSAQKAGSEKFDFDLADLQKLVESGQMTEEEYRRARDVILSRTDSKFEPVKGFPVLGPVEKPKE